MAIQTLESILLSSSSALASLNDSPRTKTTFWSDIILGAVRKMKAAVRWNSEIARIMVKADMSAMAG